MEQQEKLFHVIGQQIAESAKSQMFGKPCYKYSGKAFCCFFEKEMVFKLTGEAHREALSLDESKLFDPSGKGRPMKEWVQVPYSYKDQWVEFAEASFEYLRDTIK